MIELSEQQRRDLDQADQPPVVVDPQTGQRYRLIKEEMYKLIQSIVKPFNKGVEDDPEMDVYEQYRKKP